MAFLPIITAPDPILKQRSSNVETVNDKTRAFMENMLETMYRAHGVGLAAPQVGVNQNILVIDFSDGEEDKLLNPTVKYPLFVVNPVITIKSEELVTAIEGCLSLEENRIEVTRPQKVSIDYIDFNNTPQTLNADGWLARIIQHEMDHLEGKLLVDYLSAVKKDMTIRKLQKLKKQSINV